MKRRVFVGLAVTLIALVAASTALAGNGTPINSGSANALTLAVFGDAPYGASNADTAALDATPGFVDAVNRDPKGDNEWADCQKAKERPGSDFNGDPMQHLAAVRSVFFPSAGNTIGGRPKQVVSQAQVGAGTDADYVENVMWEQSKTLFVTLNIPGGSNNDNDNWYGAPRTRRQTDEIAQRTQADLDWLAQAFAQANADGAGSMVIIEQADMWDLDGKAPPHIANYKQFIDSIAAKTTAFGKPVLLFNGDSHAYRSDNPLVAGAPCVIETGAPDTSTKPCTDDAYANQAANGGTYNVPNFHRVVVHGGTTFPAQPLEYTRLTDNPRADNPTTSSSFGPFSWERVQP